MYIKGCFQTNACNNGSSNHNSLFKARAASMQELSKPKLCR